MSTVSSNHLYPHVTTVRWRQGTPLPSMLHSTCTKTPAQTHPLCYHCNSWIWATLTGCLGSRHETSPLPSLYPLSSPTPRSARRRGTAACPTVTGRCACAVTADPRALGSRPGDGGALLTGGATYTTAV